MTRTSRARIRPFTRICGCRLDQAPDQRNGSAPRRRIFIYRIPRLPPCGARALWFRHGCDSPRRSARINDREPKGSCRQQLRTGKMNLQKRLHRYRKNHHDHFAGGSPKCALCAAYAAASSSIESIVAANGSILTTPEKMARSPMSVSITNAGRCVICNA